mmetsp:Transcript_178576/g.572405  ORF Transcript_178576/g.572405 Transcript_178576/m.572405 type:complete len:362 (-) Transcript_178576:84-1169(-)
MRQHNGKGPREPLGRASSEATLAAYVQCEVELPEAFRQGSTERHGVGVAALELEAQGLQARRQGRRQHLGRAVVRDPAPGAEPIEGSAMEDQPQGTQAGRQCVRHRLGAAEAELVQVQAQPPQAAGYRGADLFQGAVARQEAAAAHVHLHGDQPLWKHRGEPVGQLLGGFVVRARQAASDAHEPGRREVHVDLPQVAEVGPQARDGLEHLRSRYAGQAEPVDQFRRDLQQQRRGSSGWYHRLADQHPAAAVPRALLEGPADGAQGGRIGAAHGAQQDAPGRVAGAAEHGNNPARQLLGRTTRGREMAAGRLNRRPGRCRGCTHCFGDSVQAARAHFAGSRGQQVQGAPPAQRRAADAGTRS